MPEKLYQLGDLTRDLEAYFPLDSTAKGGLAWSDRPIGVYATPQVVMKQQGGRTYTDFTQQGACLMFDPPLELDHYFTIAAWVQTPTPHNNGLIWQGDGCLLYLKATTLNYWLAKENKAGVYARTGAPLHGWVHVAVVGDGIHTQCFLNGNPLDSVDEVVSPNIISEGSHFQQKHQAWMMAAGISEQYLYSRCLTAEEIKKLMDFSAPPQ